MTKLFNNILVPVDFSPASELAIEKSIDIANHFRCNVHLVFAEPHRMVSASAKSTERMGGAAESEARLYQLQHKFTYQLQPGLSMYSCVRKGNRNRAVIQYTLTHEIDLVIIGRETNLFNSLFRSSYNVNEITTRLECPVLTVRKDGASDRLMNIVLPVCSMLPIRKIMFASYLAKKYNSKIHLLSIADDENEKESERNKYLYKAYQLLRDNTNLMIECHTVRGHNIADTTLRFARKINADLIVINPGQESRLSGLINKLFDGNLFKESNIPVMTISAT